MGKTKAIKDYTKVRKAMKLNQTAFWGRLGVTQSSGCRYEKKVAPVPASVAMLAHIIYIEGHPADAADFAFTGK